MCALLRFLVEEALAGRAAQLKEYTIATQVFDKPADFDPGTSAVVRVEVGRLRRLLTEYLADHAREDLLQIQVPKGSYIPNFTRAPAPVASRVVPSEPPKSGTDSGERGDWPAQERRLVTALSCALTDKAFQYSTGGELLTLLDSLHERCAAIGLRHGGEVDGSASDRLMIYFGWPNALEDAPGRALTAALEIIAEAKSVTPDQILAPRIGVATSEAITRPSAVGPRLRPAVMGEAPALATRMQLRAPPNTILVAESTRRMSGTVFQFLPAGELEPGEQGNLVWRLLRARPVTTRFRSQHREPQGEIIGRREERALLMSRWRLSLGGEGQAVLLVGEAGIGKSRLAESVLEQVRRDRNGIYLRAQCSPHHTNSALFPVIALLKARLGLSHGWRDARTRVTLALRRLGLENELNRGLLTDLVSAEEAHDGGSLSASQRKELTLKLLTRIVLSLASSRPTVLLIEDVHWADPTTLELLQDLVAAASVARLLVVLTSRPGGAPSLAQQTNVTSIRLTRLPRNDCSALIDRMATATDLSAASRTLILERAEGIPLFLEELTKLLLAVQPLDPSDPMVPESLNDLLAVQLDRLGPTRGVAQIASVIGRTFSKQMLTSVTGHTDTEIESALDQLLAAGMLIRDHSDAAETYAFRHALLRDAAYRSLLATTRRALHLRVGNILIEYFPSLAAEHPEVVAQHLQDGGRPDESIPFWTDAARIAASRYVLAEAIAHLRMALAALKSLTEGNHRERELALLIELGLVIRSAHGYGDEELHAIYQRAQLLAEEVGQPSRYLEVVYGLWTHAAGRGHWRRALDLAHQFEQRARHLGHNDLLELESLRLLGACDAFMGSFASARAQHERASSLYDPARHGPHFGFDPGAAAMAYLSWTHWHLGDAAAGRQYAARALAAADAKAHPPTQAMVLSWLMFHAVCDENLEAIDAYNARLQAVCSERECRYWQPLGAAFAEWAAFCRDGDARRVQHILEFTDAFEERYLTSCLLLLAARMCLVLKWHEQGLEIVDRARIFIGEHDERVWEAEAACLHAELLERIPNADHGRAEQLLRHAITVARGQGAAPFERRAQECLSRLLAPAPNARRA
jgi:class 3 adenylate cyclase